MKSFAVLGAGAWGTAIALHLAKAGFTVYLWGRNKEKIKTMQAKKENPFYLPGIPFPATLHPTDDLAYCLNNAEEVCIAVPSHAFVALLDEIEKPQRGIFWLTKGLCPTTHHPFHTLIQEKWGKTYPTAILSGPSFAKEVAQGLPAALTLASNDAPYQKHLQSLLHQDNLRVYLSTDLLGVALCGTLKNVLAIACGMSDGLAFGANARAALITRGLSEMTRLGLAMGAKPETFTSLAGLGDLVLTCTDKQSRNYRFGKALAEGSTIQDALTQIQQVVEGCKNAPLVMALAHEHQVELPICEAVNQVLLGKSAPKEAALDLMTRKLPS